MQARPMIRQSTFVDQPGRIGVVARAVLDASVAKMIDTAVADVAPVDPARLDQYGRECAVGFQFGGDRRQAQHGVHLVDHGAEESVRGFGFGMEDVEAAPRRIQHVVGGQCAAAHAAHAIGQHAERASRCKRAAQQRDAILLFGAVAPMLGGAAADDNIGRRRPIRPLAKG